MFVSDIKGSLSSQDRFSSHCLGISNLKLKDEDFTVQKASRESGVSFTTAEKGTNTQDQSSHFKYTLNN